MNKSEIIKRVMAKLAAIPNEVIQNEVSNLKQIYRKFQRSPTDDRSFPEAVLKFMGDFMDHNPLDQHDKLVFLNEVKKNKLFNFNLNKNLERAWRLILKKWQISNYRLES